MADVIVYHVPGEPIAVIYPVDGVITDVTRATVPKEAVRQAEMNIDQLPNNRSKRNKWKLNLNGSVAEE